MPIARRSSCSPPACNCIDGADDEWLLRSEEPLQVQTVTPEFAAANPHAEILPRGRDAGALRRLMTEMQMLLHEHPVNTQRQARGLPAINAIWIHGEGILSDVTVGVTCPAGQLAMTFICVASIACMIKPLQCAARRRERHCCRKSRARPLRLSMCPISKRSNRKWLAPLSRALLGGAIAKLTVMFDEWQVIRGSGRDVQALAPRTAATGMGRMLNRTIRRREIGRFARRCPVICIRCCNVCMRIAASTKPTISISAWRA